MSANQVEPQPEVPISNYFHLRSCELKEFPLTQQDVEDLIQSFLSPGSPNESFSFVYEDALVAERYKVAVRQYLPNRRIIQVPGTDSHIRIFVSLNSICFKRLNAGSC